ncbi:MAG: sigma factor [Gemmataceae bacterium]
MSGFTTVCEDAFLAATAHVSKLLYRKLGTIHGTEEDFQQQVVVWSLEALPNFDPSRSLEAYFLSNARNRALNYLRDKVTRRDPPCRACHEGRPCLDGVQCSKYRRWLKRNRAKSNIAKPLGIEPALSITTTSSVEPEAIGAELSLLIDQNLPLDLRPFYLQMLSGVPVDSDRKRRVQQAVAEILGESEINPL